MSVTLRRFAAIWAVYVTGGMSVLLFSIFLYGFANGGTVTLSLDTFGEMRLEAVVLALAYSLLPLGWYELVRILERDAGET